MTPFDAIMAQPSAVRILKRAVSSERMASSYLFEGPSGVGKERTALALAEAVLKPDPTAARRIRSGAHPDVRFFRPRDEGNRNIQVESLRSEILPVTQFAPFEASHSFLIFPEADVSFPEQHPEAANALLKTIEEPRPNVHFILLAERPQRLLRTIRSRCQAVRFGRLPPAVLERVLEEAGVAPAERPPAIALADGRADRALALAQEGRGAELLELAGRVDTAVGARRPGSLVELAERLSKREDLALVLETLTLFYRDVAASGLGLRRDELRMSEAVVRQTAASLGPARAAARAERIRETLDALEWNTQPATALDGLLFDLSRL